MDWFELGVLLLLGSTVVLLIFIAFVANQIDWKLRVSVSDFNHPIHSIGVILERLAESTDRRLADSADRRLAEHSVEVLIEIEKLLREGLDSKSDNK